MPKIKDVDYVIIGAGSAGCVLADKLSQDGANQILVLEAGPMDRNMFIHIPAGVYNAFKNPKINWNYVTESEDELEHRSVDMPRGKVVGGSSSINSMVYMRGHPLDFDGWAKDFKLPDWDYSHCLPYFKACETSDRGEDQWRGGDGALSVSQAKLDNPLYDALIEAGEQSGQGRSDDLNGYRPEGLARYDSTTRNGRRCSAAIAFLRPALARENVKLKVRALVHRIILEGKRAVGVEFECNGERVIVRAAKEVILSAGAINSPHILMLSGIGPADHLKEVGVELKHHLASVGQNLQDHSSVLLKYTCTKPVTIHTLQNPIKQALFGAQWLANRSGPVGSHIWEAGGWARTNDTVEYPNIQYHFAPVGVGYQNSKMVLEKAFSLHVNLSRPTSKGEITLKNSDPKQKPLMRFNYLSTHQDQTDFIAGVRKARELISQPAFDAYRGTEIHPGAEATTESDILSFLRKFAETEFHPSSTCQMGLDDAAVVDGEMRVHGLDGLRVVDASVMPRVTSANLNAPTMMIALKAADFILGKSQKTPVNAPLHFNESH